EGTQRRGGFPPHPPPPPPRAPLPASPGPFSPGQQPARKAGRGWERGGQERPGRAERSPAGAGHAPRAPGRARPGGPPRAAGATLAAFWQPLNEQLEVFWIDPAGAMRGIWKQHNGPWQAPFNLTAPGFAAPGAPVAAVWQPLNEQLEVFTIDPIGTMKGVWKA